MKALIPAAGHGTRFAPWTKLIPKEMLPVGARPAIALIVDEAIEAGADEVVIITSPEKPLLKKWFELNPPKAPVVWVDQIEQHGLGHAVLQAAEHFESESEPVLILLGDALVSGGNASSAMMEISKANGGARVGGVGEVRGLRRCDCRNIRGRGAVRSTQRETLRDRMHDVQAVDRP